jgi:hypothetical protein
MTAHTHIDMPHTPRETIEEDTDLSNMHERGGDR